MISLYLLCMGVTIGLSCNGALPDEELFLQANMLYEQGQYQKAQDAYMNIEHKGYAVWFNLGNCAYHCADYPQAYAWWLRSQYDAPFQMQSAIEHKYSLLAQLHGQTQFHQPLLQRILMRISPLFVQILALFFWVVFWWCIVSGYWQRWAIGCILVALMAVVCGTLAVVQYTMFSKDYAVTRRTVMVYAGYNEQYHKVGEIDALCKVCIEDISGDWYKVRCNRATGWILNRDTIRV